MTEEGCDRVSMYSFCIGSGTVKEEERIMCCHSRML